MNNDPRQTPPEDAESTERTRRYNASKLRPRVEFGRQPDPPPPTPEAELVEPGGYDPFSSDPLGDGSGQYSGTPSTRTPFGGREFAGGRVRVYGCSPGCLMISIAVSLILTLLLNAIF